MRLIHTWVGPLVMITAIGCSNTDHRLTAWQEKQVEHSQQQAAKHQAAASALVSADAQARQELATLERSLQAERSEIGRQRDALEAERKSLADQRARAPLLSAALRGTGILLLSAAVLGIAWLLLRGSPATDQPNELEELLILNLCGEPGPLAAGRALLEQTQLAQLPVASQEDPPSADADDSSAPLNEF